MNIPLSDKQKIKILNADDLFGIMVKILEREEKIDKDKEHLWVVGLAQNLKILFIELVSLGTINYAPAEPMEVFSIALQKRAVKIILVHNHPSGELKPSEKDLQITDRLIQVGKIVNVEVYDHLIITLKSFFSFEDMDLMKKLANSKAFVPTYKQIEEAEKKAKEQGDLYRAKEVAKELKRRGLDDQDIANISKYPLEEVIKLKVRKNKDL